MRLKLFAEYNKINILGVTFSNIRRNCWSAAHLSKYTGIPHYLNSRTKQIWTHFWRYTFLLNILSSTLSGLRNQIDSNSKRCLYSSSSVNTQRTVIHSSMSQLAFYKTLTCVSIVYLKWESSVNYILFLETQNTYPYKGSGWIIYDIY